MIDAAVKTQERIGGGDGAVRTTCHRQASSDQLPKRVPALSALGAKSLLIHTGGPTPQEWKRGLRRNDHPELSRSLNVEWAGESEVFDPVPIDPSVDAQAFECAEILLDGEIAYGMHAELHPCLIGLPNDALHIVIRHQENAVRALVVCVGVRKGRCSGTDGAVDEDVRSDPRQSRLTDRSNCSGGPVEHYVNGQLVHQLEDEECIIIGPEVSTLDCMDGGQT